MRRGHLVCGTTVGVSEASGCVTAQASSRAKAQPVINSISSCSVNPEHPGSYANGLELEIVAQSRRFGTIWPFLVPVALSEWVCLQKPAVSQAVLSDTTVNPLALHPTR